MGVANGLWGGGERLAVWGERAHRARRRRPRGAAEGGHRGDPRGAYGGMSFVRHQVVQIKTLTSDISFSEVSQRNKANFEMFSIFNFSSPQFSNSNFG